MYPIAFAVVEGELKETWSWFLTLLDEDLRISQNPFAWTFISNKQKGLLLAFDEIMPDVAHRFCVRHLHNNFKTEGFGGQALKDILWKAAKATTEPEFSKHMEGMAKLDPKAPKWFINKPPIHCSRAFFSSFSKCDVLLNNLCESFNSVLLHVRDKHIWTMIESIRIYMMSRLQKNRDKMMNRRHKICPKILLKLEQNKDKATECIATKSDQFHYQVEDIYLRLFSVDLKEKTCSCRRWDLTGIPCNQPIAAIWVKKDEPEMYVHECYTVEKYMKSYNPSILPIVSFEQWPKTGIEPPPPPIYKTQPGRPTKLRKRGVDETTQKESDSRKLTLLKTSRKGKKKSADHVEDQGIIAENALFLWEATTLKFNSNKSIRKSKRKALLHLVMQQKFQAPFLRVQSSSLFVTEQIVNQINQPRVPQQQLKSSAFNLEEIGEHSREDTRSLFIERMGKQYVPPSILQDALSQSSKRVGSVPRDKKKNVP
ncbi:uncharacterized protein LOC132598512 isoform X2 [Lycium barbarum]|uniref:uncharacterized protein LOC132598512 isoform X2 n=1 Tax=Lycium barbarum TaxID=112863 RepID=UPI00293F1B38|nr:uncharacterized protein LOC132598512 isoform X2 [Lycium barbarum]